MTANDVSDEERFRSMQSQIKIDSHNAITNTRCIAADPHWTITQKHMLLNDIQSQLIVLMDHTKASIRSLE